MPTTATKTDPGLWERAKEEAKSRMGGKHSARAMQLATQIYKKKGGGYSGPKPTASSNSLKKWTKQKWQWSGKDKPGPGGTGVYLPKAKADRLKSTEEGRKKLRAASAKKREATRAGEQYSSHGLAAGTSLKKAASSPSGTFYRGMGDVHVKSVLEKGLPAGKYLTTDPEVAGHYARQGAQNVLSDWSSRTMPKAKKLIGMGMSYEDAYSRSPISAKPVGAVLKITPPTGTKLKAGLYSHLSEWTSPDVIKPEHIQVISRGASPLEKSVSAATRLTPRQVRILETLRNQPEKMKQALDAVSGRSGILSGRVSIPEQLTYARSQRKLLTRTLRQVAAHSKIGSLFLKKEGAVNWSPTTMTKRMIAGGALGAITGGIGAHALTKDKAKKRRNAVLGTAGGALAGSLLGRGYHSLSPISSGPVYGAVQDLRNRGGDSFSIGGKLVHGDKEPKEVVNRLSKSTRNLDEKNFVDFGRVRVARYGDHFVADVAADQADVAGRRSGISVVARRNITSRKDKERFAQEALEYARQVHTGTAGGVTFGGPQKRASMPLPRLEAPLSMNDMWNRAFDRADAGDPKKYPDPYAHANSVALRHPAVRAFEKKHGIQVTGVSPGSSEGQWKFDYRPAATAKKASLPLHPTIAQAAALTVSYRYRADEKEW